MRRVFTAKSGKHYMFTIVFGILLVIHNSRLAEGKENSQQKENVLISYEAARSEGGGR